MTDKKIIDAEAKSELNAAVVSRQFGGGHLTQYAVDVLRFCLQAIEDRAVLVNLEGAGMETAPLRCAADAARRHMMGEK